MSINIKVFCQFANGKQETRRFRVPSDVSSSFLYLTEKIKSVFKITTEKFHITWMDDDGDEVNINTDEELLEALTGITRQRNSDLLYLYVSVEDGSMPSNFHEGVECDQCQGPIKGFRYKCLHCDDYDLCMSCESSGNHQVHHMIRIPRKDPRANVTFAELRRTVQHGPSGTGDSGSEQEKTARQKCFEMPSMHGEGTSRRCHRRNMNRGGTWHSFSGWEGGSRRWANRHRSHFGSYAEGVRMEAVRAAEDAGRVAEEASSLAMKHASDIMKGIWTGWVGNETPEEVSPSSTPTAATGQTQQEASTKNQQQDSAEGVNIDITVNNKDGVKHRCSVVEEPIDCVQPVTEMIEVIDLSRQDSIKDEVQPMETNIAENSENTSEADGWHLINAAAGIIDSSEGVVEVTPNPLSAPQKPQGQNTDSIKNCAPPATDTSKNSEVDSTVISPPSSYMNQRIKWALKQMIMMGYSDEGGLLTRLLQENNGNINETLDAILAGKH